jgi:hypothetical protein
MLFPSICLDNFFRNPKEVVNFSNSLNYFSDPEGEWPGERTDLLHNIDINFFNFFSSKVFSILYPMGYEGISYNLKLCFQKISSKYINNGWIHKDPDQLTVICYLSNHKNCGTSIYDYKKSYPLLCNDEEKKKIYKTLNLKNEKKFLKENNDTFEETISFNSKFNRVIMFDSSLYHAAQKFVEEDVQEDRLTLIGFFNNISGNNIKYPVVENNRL